MKKKYLAKLLNIQKCYIILILKLKKIIKIKKIFLKNLILKKKFDVTYSPIKILLKDFFEENKVKENIKLEIIKKNLSKELIENFLVDISKNLRIG